MGTLLMAVGRTREGLMRAMADADPAVEVRRENTLRFLDQALVSLRT